MEYESSENLILNRGTFRIVDSEEVSKLLKNKGKKLRVKFGIDPTGNKIHLGRASTIQRLKDFQDLGHTVVLIIGDFTARIGDNSDKQERRTSVTKDDIDENLKTYKTQLSKILDLDKVEFRYNSEWLSKIDFLEIIEIAKKFTVAQMIERENFHERYINNKPIGLNEFLYPIMQGYDSVAIKADIELGGSDQLFNLLAGREIQSYYNMKKQNIITKKLLIGTDGRKMSTSWKNVINIIDTPNNIYGKVMSIKDEYIIEYFKLTTRISDKNINEIEKEIKTAKKKNIMDIKKLLAEEITTMYSSRNEALKAKENFLVTVQNKNFNLSNDIMEVQTDIESISIIDLLSNITGQIPSRSEAKRSILAGSVSIDKEKISEINKNIELKNDMIIKVGKRNIIKIKKI
jgi:tyrosyl-tRNA synthetase